MTHWLLFLLLIVAVLALDLGLLNRRSHVLKIKEALLWSLFWIALSLGFNAWVYTVKGEAAGIQFFTGYVLEKSLSVDNIFVMAMIFSYFKVPAQLQHKVLYYGILGAMIFRIILIFAGVVLISKFHWMIYVLGGFLALTGGRLLFQKEKEKIPSENGVVKLFKRFFSVTNRYHQGAFFILSKGKWVATPLFLALLVIESTDIVFALDSIPAIFAITTDPFIVYTSNIFAILGMRSLYFVLSAFIDRFHYLKNGLAAILIFVGIKMTVAPFYAIPIYLTLSVILAILAICVSLSFLIKKAV